MLFDAVPRPCALVVGDVMLDRYLRGSVRRISPEAPVPVVKLIGEMCRPGGAANVAAGIAALGCHVTLCGVIGADDDGRALVAETTWYGNVELALVQLPSVRTISKTRILGEGFHQLVRVDQDGEWAEFATAEDALREQVTPLIAEHDVVVIADYDKGTLPPELIRAIVTRCREQEKPCIVDPKKRDFGAYSAATLLTPNTRELERAVDRPLADESRIEEAAGRLRPQLGCSYLLVTRGSDGMSLFGEDEVIHLAAERREIADVSGAGDTVVSAIAAATAAGMPMAEACRLASTAAGIAVSHPGTYVVRQEELEAAWTGRSPKVLGWESARLRIESIQRSGRNVVFTNGCFDILHAGHLSCLERSRRLGDFLVVGLNSDNSVRMNKGDSRPILGEENRAQMLAGLGCVDLVVVFDELTPEALIRFLSPDVLVKGSDYDPQTMAGADHVRSRGGRIVTLPLVPGLSTSHILERATQRL